MKRTTHNRFRLVALVLSLGWALLPITTGCRKKQQAWNPTDSPAPGAEDAGTQVSSLLPRGVPRLVAVGDLHGDRAAARAVLRLARVVDRDDRWIGGRMILVQTGDILDRGDEEEAVIRLFTRLKKEARAAGGQVWTLLGNHEVMNFLWEFRHVSPKGFLAFAQYYKPGPNIPDALRRFEKKPEAFGRALAFRPGGPMSKLWGDSPMILRLGGLLFAHGAVLMEHVREGIDNINREASTFIRGTAPLSRKLSGYSSPVWARRFSKKINEKRCSELHEVLEAVKAKALIVGHTIQDGGIRPACDGAVWRIDTGMSAVYGNTDVWALEVKGAVIRTLRAPRGGVR